MKTNVATKSASRYLQQLCKHWSHKADVVFSPSHGKIVFTDGKSVEMSASDAVLSIDVSVPDGDDPVRFCGVVEEHVKRFAFREELTFSWLPVEGQ